MKLHLPRTLFAALLACFSLHAQGAVMNFGLYMNVSLIPLNSRLCLMEAIDNKEILWRGDGWWDLNFIPYGEDIRVKHVSLSVQTEAAADLPSTGFRGFSCMGLSFEQCNIVVVNSGMPLGFESCLLTDTRFYLSDGTFVDCGDSTLEGDTEIIFDGSGNIKGGDFSRVSSLLVYVGPGGGHVHGDLTLSKTDSVEFAFNSTENAPQCCKSLTVTGALTITGAAEIICLPEDGSWDNEAQNNNILFDCSEIDGTVALLKLTNAPEGMSLRKCAYNGRMALCLGRESTEPPSQSGNLDHGNKYGDLFNGDYLFLPISGGTGGKYLYTRGSIQSGIVDVGEGAEVGFTEDVVIGRPDAPRSGEPAAAMNVYGVLRAQKLGLQYASLLNEGDVAVMQDGITIGEGAAFHNSSSGSVTAACGVDVEEGGTLRNDGKIEGPVNVWNDGVLMGSGDFTSGVAVDGNAVARIGNSPGYSRFQGGLTLADGASIIFTVDGTTPATRGADTAGTHSQAHITGGTLTLGGTVNTTVEITAGILNAGTAPFTLTLLEVEGGRAQVAGSGSFTLSTLEDSEKLLVAGSASLEWDKDAGTLLFHGTVDPTKAVQRMAPDATALVDTLWSSTSTLRAFARNATSQLAAPAGENGVSVWGGGLGDFVTMSGFRSQAYGFAVGADKQWCPHVRAGIALGQMVGDHTADRGLAEVEQESIMLGLYGEYRRELTKRHGMSVTAYAACGRVENDADTRLLGSSEVPGKASWDDDVFSAGLRAQWEVKVTDKLTLSPFIGLEYLRGEQASFTEQYEGGSREYWGGAMQVWSLPAGVTASTECDLGGGRKLLPWLTVGYVGDISRENPHGNFRAYGMWNRHHGSSPGRHGFMLNTGAHWQISDSWSVGASYNVETRSHETSHEGNFSLRYAF